MSAVGKFLGHDRIHGNHHVSLLGHLFVAVLNLLTDPLLEGLADHDGADVHDPLLRSLRKVDVVGEEVGDVWLVGDELEDLFDGERLVLRHVEVLDLVVEQVPLLLVQYVFEEVHGRVVYRREPLSQERAKYLP